MSFSRNENYVWLLIIDSLVIIWLLDIFLIFQNFVQWKIYLSPLAFIRAFKCLCTLKTNSGYDFEESWINC
jgi:hypothetical protein